MSDFSPAYGQNPSGVQTALQVDASGNLLVNAAALSPTQSIAINDNTTRSQHWHIDASGAGSQNLTEVNGTAISLGQNTMANSLPVAIASNQSTLSTNLAQINGATLSATNPSFEQPVAGTTGGSTPGHAISAASTNATSVKASAGLLYGITISNTNAAARYFKLYDKASAPTVGTDVPKSTIQIPANSTVARVYPVGLTFALGIAYAATTGIADADTGAVGASDLSMDVDYK